MEYSYKEKSDHLVCADIILDGTPDEQVFQNIRTNLLSRKPTRRGIFIEELGTRTRLVGNESRVLSGLANHYINGDLLGVDMLLPDGINISAKVTQSEAARIIILNDRFRVRAAGQSSG